jgi:NAD(P)-dependent dehydrogenase (short-subunit alcohol dehydrogenase family)
MNIAQSILQSFYPSVLQSIYHKVMKKIVIITGAAGNLGKAAVEKFIGEGYHVIATIDPSNASHSFEDGSQLEHHLVDISNEAEVEAFVGKIASYADSTIEAAILLVGGFAVGGIAETGQVQLRKMIELNFETAYFMARAVFQHLLTQESGGRIVFIGARPALEPQEGKDLMAYALSKSLLFKLSDLLNAEGKKKNIVSSVLVPSTIDTARNRKDNPMANFDDWVKPEEVADTLAFLLSPAGRKLRDTVLKVYANA